MFGGSELVEESEVEQVLAGKVPLAVSGKQTVSRSELRRVLRNATWRAEKYLDSLGTYPGMAGREPYMLPRHYVSKKIRDVTYEH